MVESGPERILVGFTTESPRVPRQGYDIVTVDDTPVGKVCSGSPSPTVGTTIGTAYVVADHAAPGTLLAMEIRGKRHEITLHALPFSVRVSSITPSMRLSSGEICHCAVVTASVVVSTWLVPVTVRTSPTTSPWKTNCSPGSPIRTS